MARVIIGKKQATRNVWTATGVPQDKSSTPSTDFVKYINDDAVLNSNLRQLQDGVFENYPRISNKNKNSEKYNNQLKNVGFGKKLKNQFSALWYNGNSFFEIDVVGNELIGFYEIDAETMKVNEDDNGEVINYKQSLGPNQEIILPKEKIIHIKAPSLRTGAVGKPLLEPLKYPLARKTKAENYLAGMVGNLNPLLFMNLVDTDDEQIKAIQAELRRGREYTDPLKIISLLEGEKVGRVDTGSTANFSSIQDYINAQNDEIIRVVQIPPIVAGTVDNSNRSNSEIQERAVFGRTASAWRNFYINELYRQFEEKVGWKEPVFEFPENDDRKKEAVLVRANKFKELGYSNKAIHKLIEEAGFEIEPDFVEQDIDKVNVKKDINDMPSRQPRPKEGVPQNEAQRLSDVKNGTKKVSQ